MTKTGQQSLSDPRSDKDYAIEHGGYLANAAEHLLRTINKRYEATGEVDDKSDFRATTRCG